MRLFYFIFTSLCRQVIAAYLSMYAGTYRCSTQRRKQRMATLSFGWGCAEGEGMKLLFLSRVLKGRAQLFSIHCSFSNAVCGKACSQLEWDGSEFPCCPGSQGYQCVRFRRWDHCLKLSGMSLSPARWNLQKQKHSSRLLHGRYMV